PVALTLSHSRRRVASGRASPVRPRPRRLAVTVRAAAAAAPCRGTRGRRAGGATAAAAPGHGLDLLEDGDDLPHGGPVLVVGGEAPERELRRTLRAPGRVLPLEARVHEPSQLPAVGQEWLGPVHQVVLPAGPPGVERAEPRQELQQHDAEAVHVALHVQVARRHVLRRRVAVGAHHAGRHVAAAAGRPVLGEPEVGELRVELL
ncbi:Os02g0670200, partial [Oryza sativa Japonica Group]